MLTRTGASSDPGGRVYPELGRTNAVGVRRAGTVLIGGSAVGRSGRYSAVMERVRTVVHWVVLGPARVLFLSLALSAFLALVAAANPAPPQLPSDGSLTTPRERPVESPVSVVRRNEPDRDVTVDRPVDRPADTPVGQGTVCDLYETAGQDQGHDRADEAEPADCGRDGERGQREAAPGKDHPERPSQGVAPAHGVACRACPAQPSGKPASEPRS